MLVSLTRITERDLPLPDIDITLTRESVTPKLQRFGGVVVFEGVVDGDVVFVGESVDAALQFLCFYSSG